MIYILLFFEFAKISIVCVGGGYASMPLMEASVVDAHHWLSLSEFIDIFTISQMTPGPIGINAATFAGMKIAGPLGAVCATMGFVTPSVLLSLIVAKIFFKYGDIGPVQGILNGLRPAVVALIVSAGLGFVFLALWNTEHRPENFLAFDKSHAIILALAIIATAKKISVIKVLLGSGALGLIFGIMGL